MQAGDQVVYVRDPKLFGTGTIERVLADGRIVVMFDDLEHEEFTPDELELLHVWLRDNAAAA